jgi:Tfp pilus assembly protein PilF
MRGAATARKASLIVAAAITGCAGPSPFEAPAGMQPPASNMTLPAPSSGEGPMGRSAPTPATQSSGPTLTPPVVTSGSETQLPPADALHSPTAFKPSPSGYLASSSAAVAASLRNTRNSISSALTIQPRVTPASDPTRLDSRPANANLVSADLHYHAARVYEATNSLESATAHYRDALIRSPNDPKLVLSYSRVQDRAGNFQEAEAGYRRAIALAPNDAKAFNDLAMCHNRQGKWDSAIGNLQHAIQLDPANPLYRNNLALVLVDAGRSAEALPQLVAVHGEAAAHYNLGYMLLDRKLTAEAEQHFTRALELNPQLTQARQMLEFMQFGNGAEQAPPETARSETASQETARQETASLEISEPNYAKRLPATEETQFITR